MVSEHSTTPNIRSVRQQYVFARRRSTHSPPPQGALPQWVNVAPVAGAMAGAQEPVFPPQIACNSAKGAYGLFGVLF